MRALAAAAMAVLAVLALALAVGSSTETIAAPGDTVLVSASDAGEQANIDSTMDDVSPDGRFITFTTASTNLGDDPPNTFTEVFIRDRDADEDSIVDESGAVDTEFVSVRSAGLGDGSSYDSGVDEDGRYVVFTSDNSQIVAGDTNAKSDIFVRDRAGETTTRISVSSSGAEANDASSFPSISDDGRFVAFCSLASNLVASDSNNVGDVFLRDRDTDADGIYDEPTDVATIGVTQPAGIGCAQFTGVAISGNGQFVAYLGAIWDRLSNTTEPIASGAYGPSISADGRYVAFSSPTAFLPGDTNGTWDVFLWDRMLATYERVSLRDSGGQSNGFSDGASVSDDGRYVAFESLATNLVPGDTNANDDIFVRDRQTPTTYRVSVDSLGNETCAGPSSGPVIDSDGLQVGFTSTAGNGKLEAFVHEGSGPTGTPCIATPTPSATPGPTPISAGVGSGSSFKPMTSVILCNALPASGFGDGSASGNPSCADATNDGVTATNTLPSGHLYYSSQVTFVPNGGTAAAGSAGTLAGGVRNTASLGLANAPCNAIVDEDFVLYNVALPDNVGDPRASSNIVYPMAAGTADRFSKWKVGSEPTGADPSGIDTGGDPNYAVGTSLAFENYPSYLLDTFDADGVGGAPPLYPQAVYGALTNFGGQWRPLFLVKLPASASPFYSPAFPAGAAAKPAMGSALVWVLGDPTDGVPTPDNITDTCSPATTTITLIGSTSLATGTDFYLEYLSSGRDLDQDGYENAIDTCPLKVNVGNPRTGTGDTDGDGIDDACDPGTPTPVAADDFDGDGFVNRGDNCALASNASQSEAERAAPTPADRGPVVDNIGDACDSEAGTIAVSQNCSTAFNGGINPTPCATPNVSITLSDAVANGRYMTVTNVVAKCVGGTDADGDGYCAAQDSGDSGACETTAPPSCTTRHNQWTATQPMMQMDTDGDKQSDALETYVGTDPVQSCSQTVAGNNEPMDNWMFSLTDHPYVNGQDDGLYAAAPAGVGNTFVAQGPFTLGGITRPGVRFDFNADGVMNGQDVAKIGGVGPYGGTGPNNKTCASAGIPAFHQQ